MTSKNFSFPLSNLDGSYISEAYKTKDEAGNDVTSTRSLTAARAVVAALENPLPGDEKLTMKEILSNMELAEQIHCGTQLPLSSEDKVMIKERVRKAWPLPIVLYRITQFLED